MFRSLTYRDGADEDVGPRGVDLVLREVVEERLHLGGCPPRLMRANDESQQNQQQILTSSLS